MGGLSGRQRLELAMLVGECDADPVGWRGHLIRLLKYLQRERITRHDFHRRDIDLLSPAGLYAALLDFRDRLPDGSDAARLLADAGVVREGGRGCDA